MPFLSAAQLASMRRTHQSGLGVVAIGGATWTATHAADSTTSSVTGYAYQEQPDHLIDLQNNMPTLPGGVRAPSQPWRFVLVAGALAESDAIVSAADPAVQFAVRSVTPGALYPAAIIEPIGLIPAPTP